MSEQPLRRGVHGDDTPSDTPLTPSDVPLYEDQSRRDEQYRAAEREGRPYLAIECYEGGYAVTYDLLPAGAELSGPAHKELRERIRHTVEEVVGDQRRATVEVSQSVSASLGNIGIFRSERTAREIAVVIGRFALDENNWVEASGVGPAANEELRRN